jgi:hypothetical protein
MKQTPQTFSTQRGFSTIEILIAFAVGILFLSAALMLAYSNPSQTMYVSLDTNHTATLDIMFDMYGLATSSNNLGNVLLTLSENWDTQIPASSEMIHDGLTYTNTPDVLDIAPCMKFISQKTTWGAHNGRARNITTDTGLSNLEIAEAVGSGTCDPTPPSTWDTPDTLAALTGNTLEGEGTDIVIIHKDSRRYALITTLPVGANDTPDLWVIDVSDPLPTHPPLIRSLNVSTSGLLGIARAGTYAYITQNNSIDQIYIVDITDPQNPNIIPTHFTLPHISTTCSPLGIPCDREAVSISYHDGYLYVGTKYLAFGTPGTNEEFHIICVDDVSIPGCSPTTPVWMDSYNVNHHVLAIDVRETLYGGSTHRFAYLAVSDTSGTNPELMILDVTNPQVITSLSGLNFPGTLYGTALFSMGNILYMGRMRATGSNKDFYIIDTEDPYHPRVLGSLKLGLSTSGSKVTSIHVQGGYAFVATNDPVGNHGFHLLDIRDPTNIHTAGQCTTYMHALSTTRLAYADNIIFTVNTSGDVLRILYDTPAICTP